MTAVGAEQPRPAPDEYLDALRAAGRRDWIPEECSVDGDVISCPREVLQRLLLAAAAALFKARLLERALREHEGLYENIRGRLEALEEELGWLREELVGAERLVERLLGGLEEVEALRRELEGVRARAERVVRLAESWVTVWECRVQVPHPDTVRRRCRERGEPRLCLLASRASNAKYRWYDLLSRLPVLETERGVLVLVREEDARLLEREWRRIWAPLVDELRKHGYSTRAGFECRRVRKLPEEILERVEAEIAKLRREIEEKTRRLDELRARGASAKSLRQRLLVLHQKLQVLEGFLRELCAKLPRDARAKTATAVARG